MLQAVARRGLALHRSVVSSPWGVGVHHVGRVGVHHVGSSSPFLSRGPSPDPLPSRSGSLGRVQPLVRGTAWLNCARGSRISFQPCRRCKGRVEERVLRWQRLLGPCRHRRRQQQAAARIGRLSPGSVGRLPQRLPPAHVAPCVRLCHSETKATKPHHSRCRWAAQWFHCATPSPSPHPGTLPRPVGRWLLRMRICARRASNIYAVMAAHFDTSRNMRRCSAVCAPSSGQKPGLISHHP